MKKKKWFFILISLVVFTLLGIGACEQSPISTATKELPSSVYQDAPVDEASVDIPPLALDPAEGVILTELEFDGEVLTMIEREIQIDPVSLVVSSSRTKRSLIQHIASLRLDIELDNKLLGQHSLIFNGAFWEGSIQLPLGKVVAITLVELDIGQKELGRRETSLPVTEEFANASVVPTIDFPTDSAAGSFFSVSQLGANDVAPGQNLIITFLMEGISNAVTYNVVPGEGFSNPSGTLDAARLQLFYTSPFEPGVEKEFSLILQGYDEISFKVKILQNAGVGIGVANLAPQITGFKSKRIGENSFEIAVLLRDDDVEGHSYLWNDDSAETSFIDNTVNPVVLKVENPVLLFSNLTVEVTDPFNNNDSLTQKITFRDSPNPFGWSKVLVSSSESTFMWRSEIVARLMNSCVGAGQCSYTKPNEDKATFGVSEKENFPMNFLTKAEILQFADYFSGLTGVSTRLCTKDELVAARSLEKTLYECGEDPTCLHTFTAVRESSGGNMQPVASYSANRIGIYDLSGSVDEWTSDTHPAYGTIFFLDGHYDRQAMYVKAHTVYDSNTYPNGARFRGFRLCTDQVPAILEPDLGITTPGNSGRTGSGTVTPLPEPIGNSDIAN